MTAAASSAAGPVLGGCSSTPAVTCGQVLCWGGQVLCWGELGGCGAHEVVGGVLWCWEGRLRS